MPHRARVRARQPGADAARAPGRYRLGCGAIADLGVGVPGRSACTKSLSALGSLVRTRIT